MRIVAVEFRVAPEQAGAFEDLARALAGPTRDEAGCHDFEFFADLDRSGRYHLFEVWESEEHLEAHRHTPHVAAFRSGTAALGLEVMEARRWTAAG